MAGPVATEFEAANAKYAAQFTKGDLPMPPGRYVAQIHLRWLAAAKHWQIM
jgi:hypothetical protein